MNVPTPDEIRDLRLEHVLKPSQAAALVHRSTRAWLQYEQGVRQMDAAAWELFQIKLNREL